MGIIAESMVAYAQPLLEQTDGSEEQLNKAFQLSTAFYTIALLPEDRREAAIVEMRSAFDMDDKDFDEFRRETIEPMLRRHEEMFPRMHARGLNDEPEYDNPQIVSAPRERHRRPAILPPTAPKKRSAIDRYAPCPCNSGKKYKFCCGSNHR